MRLTSTVSLTALLQKSCPYRTWVLQEMVIASHIFAHCGIFELPFAVFMTIQIYLDASDNWITAKRYVSTFFIIDFQTTLVRSMDLVNALQERYEKGQDSENIEPFPGVLLYYRFSNATDSRDKIHVLSEMSSVAQKIFRPDYTRSVAQVYASSTIQLMKSQQSLWLLEQVASLVMVTSMPSWVPQLDAELLVNNIQYFNELENYKLFQARGDHPLCI